MGNVLDQSLIKDLSNHIYEKRKATAFQIESLTKAALARNDSQTIYKILNELTELTNSGTNSAKMGAITALGSVSVALGSFAIAYFLDEIIRPIFSTFRDTDARVRYYACESLYNIAKIARGEILLYFNEVFDILCILVTDSESLVKNAADILDRLIKDIVAAKATNYVLILQQQEVSSDIQTHLVDANGVAIQVNQPQDSHKAFLLPKFIPTLLERMYIIDPFAKKFLIGWLELFDDIPSLELITFLPNFLEPLLKFLMHNAPSDVRLETENILNVFLKEIKAIYQVRLEVKRKQLIQEHERKQREQLEQAKQSSAASIESNTPKAASVHEDTEADDDAASIKSSDTTIVRKPEAPAALDGSQEFDTGVSDGEILLNGQDIFIDYPKIIDILLSFLRIADKQKKDHSKINDLSNEPHEICLEIQFIVLKWLQQILETVPIGFVKYVPDCVSVILKNISIADFERDVALRNEFLSFSLLLQAFLVKFASAASSDTDNITDNAVHGLNKELYDEFVENHLPVTLDCIVTQYLTLTSELSRITSLDWLIFLYTNNSESFFKFVGSLAADTHDSKNSKLVDNEAKLFDHETKLFDVTDLLKSSADGSNEVILKVLQFLLIISEANEDFFKEFMVKLVRLLEREMSDKSSSAQPTILRNKIEFIIRKLCVTLNSERIFKTLSEVLLTLDDLDFLDSFIVTLNTILLTTQELAGFRKKLKSLDVYKLEDWALFATLFQSWCHNSPSALSLCLLTSNYELGYLIIKNLSELEMTFKLLTELDVLVQLLESPIFLKLRLQLLEPEKNPYLYKTLYGLLMILPQSSTFTTLKNRLGAIAHVYTSNITSTGAAIVNPSTSSTSGTPVISTPGANSQLSIKRKRIYEMLDKFTKVQDKHEELNLSRKLKESQFFSGDVANQPQQQPQGTNPKVPTHSRAVSYTPTVTTTEKRDYFSNSPAVAAASAAAAAAGADKTNSNKFAL